MLQDVTHCYVDESVHTDQGFVATAFVFTDSTFEKKVGQTLENAGLSPRDDELKSSARMDVNPSMRAARDAVLGLVAFHARIAVFFGPYSRSNIGKDSLQALQSVLLRNGLLSGDLEVRFDEDIFPTTAEAYRLQRLFHGLRDVRIYPRDDSRRVLGIQTADVIAHSFGQILKSEISGESKEIEIGGPDTGYPEGTKAPLGWSLLMNLRYSMFTRPAAYEDHPYHLETDPVIVDPIHDDPVAYAQNPVLVGWGVQVAPEASAELRFAIERSLGRLWLGCVH